MTVEAENVFAEQVARWRGEPWASLRERLKKPVAYEIAGPSGTRYQFEVLVFWDRSRREGNLRVIITGDDGEGWKIRGRSMRVDDFIKAPDETFIGE
jgi:hypothetical protein